MEEDKCELCGKEDEEDGMWVVFGHWFCEGCAKKFENYIQTTVDIAEQERKRQQNKMLMNDVSEFAKIKEGKKDIIRTSKAYLVGDEIELCYDGFAYKDSVKCKVTGSHKAASDGYIVELIKL